MYFFRVPISKARERLQPEISAFRKSDYLWKSFSHLEALFPALNKGDGHGSVEIDPTEIQMMSEEGDWFSAQLKNAPLSLKRVTELANQGDTAEAIALLNAPKELSGIQLTGNDLPQDDLVELVAEMSTNKHVIEMGDAVDW